MKLNKIILGISAFAVLTLFYSCASTEDSVKEVVFEADAESQASEEGEEETEAGEEEGLLVIAEEESSFKVEASAPAGREKKNYTGWISSSLHPITNVYGNVKLYANPKKGTFGIFVLNEDEKAVPVISSANEYTTSSFYLKAGNKIFKLCDDSSVASAAKKTEHGIRIRYTIERNAVVIIDFDCFSSVEGEAEDSVKVTAAIISLAKKKTDFSLKMLFDTVLGETDRHHFYTSEGLPVKGETLYHSMEEDRYFTSKNAKASMQMIFEGGEASPVQTLILANFTTLDTKKWEPDMTSFRSFDTVLSYNNSAVGVYWPKTSLLSDEEKTFVFYISMATGERIPGGAAYLYAKDHEQEVEEESPESAEETEADGQENAAVQNIQAVKEEEAAVKAEVKENPAPSGQAAANPPAQPKEEEKPEEKVTVIESPKQEAASPVNKLSYDYIQKLLMEIEELESGDPNLNKDRINELNAELDEILAILNEN